MYVLKEFQNLNNAKKAIIEATIKIFSQAKS